MMMIVLVYLLSVAVEQPVSCTNSPQCDAWSALEQTLQRDEQTIVCNKFNNCSGMKCSGKLYGDEIHTGIEVNYCENPVSVSLSADVPEFNLNAWRKTFVNGEIFNLTDSLICNFSLQREKDQLVLGLNIKYEASQNKFMQLIHNEPLKLPVFHNVVIPVPACSNPDIAHIENISVSPAKASTNPSSTPSAPLSSDLRLDKGNCSITNSSCGPFEICRQIDKFRSDGICVCKTDYIRDWKGKCIYNPSVETSSVSPNHTEPSTKVHPSNTSVLLTAILVPITVILFVVGLAYAIIRFRIFQYLRRRLRVQVYEHVQLGQDDDNDEQLTNPIA